MEQADPKYRLQEVRLLIDGVDLIELVAAVERPFAAAEGHPQLAGSYVGPDPRDAYLPMSHLLGNPAPGSDWSEDASSIPLLRCECGEWGCWPLLAMVEIGDRIVTWRDFRNPHRPDWDHKLLGPFRFDRRQYEGALSTG